MNIHEYVAKSIFEKENIRVPRSYMAYSPEEATAKAEMIAKPVFTSLSEDYTPMRTTERSPYICRIQNVYIFNYQNFKK